MTNSVSTWPECSGVAQPDVERDEVEVDRVEHQLDGHQHQDRVAAGQHAVDADAEQQRGERRTGMSSGISGHLRSSGRRAPADVAAGQHDRADQGGEQQHATAPRTAAPRCGTASTPIAPARCRCRRRRSRSGRPRSRPRQQTMSSAGGRRAADQRCDAPVGAGQVGQRADRRPGEHQREQQQHDDRADVDQHLHPGDELGGEQQVAAGDRAEGDDQPQRRVHEVPGGHDQQRRRRPRPAPSSTKQHLDDGHVARRSGRSRAGRCRPRGRCLGDFARRRPPSGRGACGSSAGGGGTVAIHSPQPVLLVQSGRGCRTRRTRTPATRTARRTGRPRCRCRSTCRARSRSRTGRARCGCARGRPASPAAIVSLCESM